MLPPMNARDPIPEKTAPANPPMIPVFPDDAAFLMQFARAAMIHAHLDNALKMYLRSLLNTSVEEALDYVGFQGAKKMRIEIEELAKEKLNEESQATIAVFMQRARALSEQRNEWLHSPIARERDGTAIRMRVLRDEKWPWVDLPTVEQLAAFTDSTHALITEMTHERISGLVGLDIAIRIRGEKIPG
jgi:hypothetical protein